MKKLIWMGIALLLVVIVAFPVFAQDDGAGKVVFGGSFRLRSGETLDSDLVVFGGTATLEEDSLVRGDMAMLGGSATVAGEVGGDMVVFGGNVKLEKTAQIEGQLVNFGATVRQEEGAVIRGGITEVPWGGSPRAPWFPYRQGLARPGGWVSEGGRLMLSLIWGVVKAIGWAVVLTILGLLIVLFWPEQSRRVGDTAVAEPLPSLGVGLLSLVVAFCVGLILLIAACAGLLVWLAAAIAWIFGWTAVGLVVGQRVLEAFQVEPTEPLAVIVGVALISLVWAFPCLGSLFALIVGAAGLGAVVLTRAGTRPYPPPPLSPSPIEEGPVREA